MSARLAVRLKDVCIICSYDTAVSDLSDAIFSLNLSNRCSVVFRQGFFQNYQRSYVKVKFYLWSFVSSLDRCCSWSEMQIRL